MTEYIIPTQALFVNTRPKNSVSLSPRIWYHYGIEETRINTEIQNIQLQVEKFKARDIGRVCSWIKSESVMVQWAGPAFSWPMTQKQFREQLRAAKGKAATLFPFGLYRGSVLLGYCELARYDRKSQSAHLSRVIISPKHRNKGFAKIVITSVLKFGFEELGLNRIMLGVFDFNKPAIKCYKKMGFKLEGTLRQTTKVGDSFWNCHMMSILRKEWQAKL